MTTTGLEELIGVASYEFTLRDIFGDREMYGFDLDSRITRRTTELGTLVRMGVCINKLYSYYMAKLHEERTHVSSIAMDSSIGDDYSIHFVPAK